MKPAFSNSTRIASAGRLTVLVLLALSAAVPRARAAADARMFAAPFLVQRAGCAPSAVAAGDLNGDGRQDLVVSNWQGLGFTVLIGNGDWTFASPVSYPTGMVWTTHVALADLDGDGALDLAVMGGTLSVLLGNGDGTFGPRSDYADPGSFVAIGDVSGDGVPDLVTAGGTVSVRIGDGSGAFGARTDYPASANWVAIGDLNRNGIADLAVAGSSSVSVWPGTGGGSFGPAIWTAPATGLSSVGVGDLNGDGNPDLVTASSSQVSVYLGDGSGVFGTPVPYGSCAGGHLQLADLDGDADLDVASGVSVLLGNGDGALGACTPHYSNGAAARPAVADLNGDGKRDIIVADRNTFPGFEFGCSSGTVSMLPGRGDGTFGEPGSLFETGDGPRFVTSQDLNGDGRPDLVTANPVPGTVSVLLGQAHGGFGAKTDFPAGVRPYAVAIGDLDRDGAPDLAVANSGSKSVSILLGDGDGTFGPRTDFATAPQPVSVATGDFNRDGNPDLATASSSGWSDSPMMVSVLLGQGDGAFAPRLDIVIPPSHGAPRSVAVGDLDADGSPDLVVALGPYDGAEFVPREVAVVMGNGDGTFAAPVLYPAGYNPTFAAIGDLNLDGRPDLAVANAGYFRSIMDWPGGDSKVTVLEGNGDGTFTAGESWSVGDYPSTLLIADLDGDGKPDLAVPSNYYNNAARISVLLGRGDGTFGSRLDYGAAGNVSWATSGDFNGDAQPDLALAIGATDRVMILRNVTPGWPTPALLSLFHGAWSGAGVELRWQFGDPGRFTGAEVQRGESVDGPWRTVEGEPRAEGGTWVMLDRSAEARRTHFYRLLAMTAERGPMIFGPLEIAAGAPTGEFALFPVVPNPSYDRVRIGFAVAHPAYVRLGVLDVMGRRVTQLVDGVRTPGRYEVAWDGTTGGGRAPAGVYFVRYEAAGVRRVQRLVLTR